MYVVLEVKMPKEARQTTFKNNEVIDALREFCHQTDRDLPTDQPSALSFANDSQITVYLHHTAVDIPSSTFTQSGCFVPSPSSVQI